MNEVNKHPADDLEGKTFVEGVDFYFEEGLMVLTARFLMGRGYCCGNNCRHCPYTDAQRALALEKKLL